MKTHLTSIALLTCALALAGCNKPAVPDTAPKASIGTEIDDSVITTKAKTALLSDADFKGFDLKVETRKGEVQLSGFVDSQAQIDRATEIIRKIEGVKVVTNNVNLKGAPATVGNTVDDSIVTARVKSALLSDANIKSLDIAVATHKGEVQLSGFVENQNQITRALEVARHTEGVRNVINEMSVKQ